MFRSFSYRLKPLGDIKWGRLKKDGQNYNLRFILTNPVIQTISGENSNGQFSYKRISVPIADQARQDSIEELVEFAAELGQDLLYNDTIQVKWKGGEEDLAPGRYLLVCTVGVWEAEERRGVSISARHIDAL